MSAGLTKKGTAGPVPWNREELFKTPAVYEAAGIQVEGVKTLFFESVPYRGKPTRVFAYYALPERAAPEKVPAMVLVHGGGGSAFPHWVKMWAARGYAAIAMDTCGCISGYTGGKEDKPNTPHDHGGPPGWGGFDQVDNPVEDQWTFHAVAAVVRAHSLIRSFPQVDPDRVGLTGISWGGYLACIVAGVDPRFAFAAPVYGCGFLGDNSGWADKFEGMGKEKAERWLSLWDPSAHLPRARLPMLWVTGTNETAYRFDSFLKTIRLPGGPQTFCVRVRLPHGHPTGMAPKEIPALAEALFRGGNPLARITGTGREGRRLRVSFESREPVVLAELNYTTDAGEWSKREWRTAPAAIDAKSGTAAAEAPEGATALYINLTDARECVVSSGVEQMPLVS